MGLPSISISMSMTGAFVLALALALALAVTVGVGAIDEASMTSSLVLDDTDEDDREGAPVAVLIVAPPLPTMTAELDGLTEGSLVPLSEALPVGRAVGNGVGSAATVLLVVGSVVLIKTGGSVVVGVVVVVVGTSTGDSVVVMVGATLGTWVAVDRVGAGGGGFIEGI